MGWHGVGAALWHDWPTLRSSARGGWTTLRSITRPSLALLRVRARGGGTALLSHTLLPYALVCFIFWPDVPSLCSSEYVPSALQFHTSTMAPANGAQLALTLCI